MLFCEKQRCSMLFSTQSSKQGYVQLLKVGIITKISGHMQGTLSIIILLMLRAIFLRYDYQGIFDAY